jgi:hypothetical protein
MDLLASYGADHPQWTDAVTLLSSGEITPQLASWRLVLVGRWFAKIVRSATRLTDGQVLSAQVDEIATDLNQ